VRRSTSQNQTYLTQYLQFKNTIIHNKSENG
jgi:hypothetical protein